MECNNFCDYAELEEYSTCSVYSTSESETAGSAGRAGIAGIVVIDSDGLWTFIPESFCSI